MLVFVDISSDVNQSNKISNTIELKWEIEHKFTSAEYFEHMRRKKISRGLLLIASYLKERNYEVDYWVNSEIDGNPLFAHSIRNSKFLCISCSFTSYYQEFERIVKNVKQINPKIVIITGGYHATELPEVIIEQKLADVVVLGDGEDVIEKIIESYPYLSNVEHIAYYDKVENRLMVSHNLNVLSEKKFIRPDYALLKDSIDSYSLRIQTFRGCPNSCCFCADNKNVRYADLKIVVDELDDLFLKVNRRAHIHIIDSIFTLNKDRAKELCDIMINKNYKEMFSFSCDIRANSIDQDLIIKMSQAGINKIFIGLEDSDAQVLKIINKGISYNDVVDTALMIKRYSNIKVAAYWIVGLPGVNHQTMHNSINSIKSLIRNNIVDEIDATLFVPYPGTACYKNPSKFNIKIVDDDWSKWGRYTNSPVYVNKELNGIEISNYYSMIQNVILDEYLLRENCTLMIEESV